MNLDKLIGKKALYTGRRNSGERVTIYGWAPAPNGSLWPQLVFAHSENGSLGMDNVNQFEIFHPEEV